MCQSTEKFELKAINSVRINRMTITVLIADDHPIVQQGMQMLLEGQDDMEVVGVATNGAEAVEKVGETHPQVVLMDLNMPELNGIEATSKSKRSAPKPKLSSSPATMKTQWSSRRLKPVR